jgi:hypothetical protein
VQAGAQQLTWIIGYFATAGNLPLLLLGEITQ